jgi:regulatory protein YycI of two-component signal transduction system YycFG
MAEDNEKQLDALREVENAQKRIDELLKRQAVSNDKNAQKLQKQIDKETELIKLKRAQIKEEEKVAKQLKYKEDKLKEINDTVSIFSKLEKDVQHGLKGNNKEINAFSSIGIQIAANKQKQITATDEERVILQRIIDQQEASANNLAKMVNHHHKKNEAVSLEESVRNRMKGASEDEIQSMIIIEKLQAKIAKRHERIHDLQHQVAHEAHHLPEGIRNAVSGAMDLGKAVMKAGLAFGPIVLLVAALGAGLHAYMELDKAAGDYRETTGFTAKMTKQIDADVHHIVVAYRGLGVEAKGAYDVVDALANAQSDMFHFSEATVGSLAILNQRMGIAAKDSAEVTSMFEQIGGLSEETAASVTLQAASMASMVGVSAKEMFKDMAESSGVLASHMKGNVQMFVQQAAKAKMLGSTLKDMAKTSEQLLNFETSIEEELTAATFVGGQFNLSRARALAYEGKIADANEEVLNQIQKSGDFRKQDYFTQQQLAKAAGKSVEEISRELGVRDKLANLSGDQLANANKLIDTGVDISKLSDADLKKQAEQLAKQERISAVMTDIQDKIAGMVEAVGGRLTPVFDVLAKIIYGFGDGLKAALGFLKEFYPITMALVAGAGTYLYLKNQAAIADKASATWTIIKTGAETAYNGIVSAGNLIKKKGLLSAIAEMAMRAYTSIAAIPFVGPVLGVAAAAGALALGYQYYSKAGDVMSPADGKTRISTKEGGLFELSKNDDVVAAPGAASALSGGGGGNQSSMIGALINEFRGVRADMAGGKIGVYMDNDKVTANVTRTAERSTRNNFALQ